MDWRKLATDLALVDGKITARGALLMEREIRTTGAVEREEAEFLIHLKRASTGAPKEFDRLVYEVLRELVLLDGVINDLEARWLRKIIFADQTVSAQELQFLEDLRREARAVGPEFEALYRECKYAPEFSRS